MKRFLVIQTAFIGDVILATPIFSELKRLYPLAEIDILIRKGNESLLENNPFINKIYTLNKKENKLKSIYHLIKLFRSKKYDEIINLHRFASTGIITAFSGAKSKVGFNKNPLSFLYTKKIKHELGANKHEVERNLLCIKHHNSNSFVKPELFPSHSDFQKVNNLKNGNYYCLAPASVWFTKQLPEDKWVELGKLLIKKGNVYLVGGPGDQVICERIKQAIDAANCQNLAGEFTFLESAALFKDATMNFVNDSGPLHFCSAVNANVTSYFCSTIPAFGFGPLSDISKCVETDEVLTCRPCGIHGFKTCPKGHFKCGTTIKIDIVGIN